MLEETLKVANEFGLWICAFAMVALVVVQSTLYTRLASKTAKEINFPQKNVRRAFRTGIITGFGPALGSFIVMIAMMAVVGAPITWMRLSIIGSASTELTASTIGAEAAGFELGAANFSLEGLAVIFFTMAVNGCGWLLVAALLTGRMDAVRHKIAGGDAKWLPILTTAATVGVYANMSAQKAVAGIGPLVACAGGAVTMLIMIQVAKKVKCLKEYKMGISLIMGTVLAAIVTELMK